MLADSVRIAELRNLVITVARLPILIAQTASRTRTFGIVLRQRATQRVILITRRAGARVCLVNFLVKQLAEFRHQIVHRSIGRVRSAGVAPVRIVQPIGVQRSPSIFILRSCSHSICPFDNHSTALVGEVRVQDAVDR